jgi:hypothetical protein
MLPTTGDAERSFDSRQCRQGLLHLAQQRLRREWFGQVEDTWSSKPIARDRVFGIAGDENCPQPEAHGFEIVSRLQPLWPGMTTSVRRSRTSSRYRRNVSMASAAFRVFRTRYPAD